jgi:hypothetical protein
MYCEGRTTSERKCANSAMIAVCQRNFVKIVFGIAGQIFETATRQLCVCFSVPQLGGREVEPELLLKLFERELGFEEVAERVSVNDWLPDDWLKDRVGA